LRKSIIFGLLWPLFWGICAADPGLEVGEENWDFGDVPNIGTVSHNFNLTNRGAKAIKITNVAASCGCTSTKIENLEVSPGKTVPLLVTFNNNAYPMGGHYLKQVTVYTDDPDQPAKILTVAVTVCANEYPWGGIGPRTIEVSTNPLKPKAKWKEVTIQNQTALSQKVAVVEKVGLVQEVKVLTGRIPSGGKGKVRVKVDPPQDPFPPSSLTLQLLSEEGERRVSIPVVPEAPPGGGAGTGGLH